MVVAREEEGKGAAPVAERDPQARALLRRSPVDHGRDGQASVRGVADRIEGGLGGEAVHHRWTEGVDEDRDAKPLCLLEEALELGHAQRLPVHVRSQLDAGKPQGLDVGELLGRQVGVLQGHDPEADEAARRRLAHPDDDLVGVTAKVEGVLGREPVGAKLRHR